MRGLLARRQPAFRLPSVCPLRLCFKRCSNVPDSLPASALVCLRTSPNNSARMPGLRTTGLYRSDAPVVDPLSRLSDSAIPTEREPVFSGLIRTDDALRAAAVDGPAGCCAFLGDAGIGKSTLAASFVRRGWSLVCDDYLQFSLSQDEITIVSGFGGLRLWPDSIAAAFNDGSQLQSMQDGGKKRVQVTGLDPIYPVRLSRIYLLTPPGKTVDTRIKIDDAPAGEALVELVRHAFSLDVCDQQILQRQFRSLQRLVECVPICRLTYPRDLSHLQAVAGAITDDLRSGRRRVVRE